MAQFQIAFLETMGHEKGYVDDPDDSGGETYKGIARNHNPNWGGWAIIDSVKHLADRDSIWENDAILQSLVTSFYKEDYWDCFRADEIPDQPVGNELFDTAVNMGVVTAIIMLQDSVNALNQNGTLYGDIVVDGQFGAKTLAATQACLLRNDPKYLFNCLNILQGAGYIDIMKSNPLKEKYARGWLKRVEISKHG